MPDEFLFVFIKAREKHISGLGQLYVSDSPYILFLNLARFRCRRDRPHPPGFLITCSVK